MAGPLENPGGHAHKEMCRSKRESLVPLCPCAGRRTHRSPVAPLKRGEVLSLSDGDPPERLERHQIVRDQETYRLEVGLMGSGGVQYSCGRYGARMRAVSLHHMGGGFPGTQGEDIP